MANSNDPLNQINHTVKNQVEKTAGGLVDLSQIQTTEQAVLLLHQLEARCGKGSRQ